MTTQYKRGAAFEYRVRDDLRERGYYVARARGSKGCGDLIAVRRCRCNWNGAHPLVLLVQCKRGGTLPPAEWNTLHDLATEIGAIPLMATTPKRGVLAYHRLTGRKEARGVQPREEWTP